MLHLAALATIASLAQADPTAADPCRVDAGALMALGYDAFDQDMNGGWRALAQRAGCREEAADLIRGYRELAQRRMGLLYWHEGQLRAGIGQVEPAIRLFDQARNSTDEDGWNHYVDATIAFLRNDQRGLVQARQKLATMSWPSGLQYVDEDGTRKPGPWPGWPANLDVVDGLIACFGKPYAEAYSARCRTQAGGS